ncbi:hypothetical protein DV735_g2584, partial [Chaetothyriales sp. CBS 134920]
MNSLNLLSSRVMGVAARRPRAKSEPRRTRAGVASANGGAAAGTDTDELRRGRSYSAVKVPLVAEPDELEAGEKTPLRTEALLAHIKPKPEPVAGPARWRLLIKRLADGLTALFTALGAPFVYLVRLFRDGDGRLALPHRRGSGQSQASPSSRSDSSHSYRVLHQTDPRLRPSYSTDSLLSASTDSDDSERRIATAKATATAPSLAAKRPSFSRQSRRSSIRIKEQQQSSEAALDQRRRQKRSSPLSDALPLTVDSIKSPTSPSPSLKTTRYPHQHRPPRPLTPRRQPSYSNLLRPSHEHPQHLHQQQKTLVLDLDETLIHSLARGGRMSSGHMVEVRLNTPVTVAVSPTTPGQAAAPSQVIGPQHPILYYVHKRPHCDEFLKKVCKWYKLVIFTASVQEYADPVIDWLELERKYFAGRFYRQHCTLRNDAYIKDLSLIEPDLRKVIILDNSPVSYVFHPHNAIPIEGWISDPSDNDLLHLIPLLEALQYVPDVRAPLALRHGENQDGSKSPVL